MFSKNLKLPKTRGIFKIKSLIFFFKWVILRKPPAQYLPSSSLMKFSVCIVILFNNMSALYCKPIGMKLQKAEKNFFSVIPAHYGLSFETIRRVSLINIWIFSYPRAEYCSKILVFCSLYLKTKRPEMKTSFSSTFKFETLKEYWLEWSHLRPIEEFATCSKSSMLYHCF